MQIMIIFHTLAGFTRRADRGAEEIRFAGS